MNKLNINKNIFDLLLNDYYTYKSNKDYQNQFQVGIDFFEAVIKFFAVLNISVLKITDEKLFKKVIAVNFKDKPSLGDFKSLATHSLKSEITNEFYKFLKDIFNEKINLNNKVYSLKAIKDGTDDKANKKNNQDISTYLKLYDNYLVSFRNQLKGHSASFRVIDENEEEFVHKVINSLDLVIITLNEKLNKVLENIIFYEREHKLFAKYQDIQIELLPIMIYLPCDKYSCCIDKECKEKRIRIFFFNDMHNEKIYFLDYGYNHFYNIKDLENIYQETQNFFDNLKQYKKEINFVEYISDKGKHDNVLENFVGRKEELKSLKSHIQSNLSNATFSYIIGKPGIGKSALMAKLLEELKDETKSLKPFIFYARNSNMGGDINEEIKTLYTKIESFIRDILNDKQLKIESESMNDEFDKLFLHYETHSNSPILLIIDGLDEFKDWQKVVDTIPLNFSKNIHIIFTSRDYNDMVSHIESKITDYNSSIEILKHNSNYCLKIGKLSDNEVEELINIALPKELKQRKDYKEIIQIIIQKSESLPLYLDYLISMLKDTNIKLDEFEKWSKTLPEGIDKFYETSFKKASSEAMKLLTLLYFSLPNNYKRDLKVIFTDLEITKNIKEFENIFNEIEIFLYEVDNKYSFYHQSVKDAIEIYLNNHSELKILDNNKLSEILYFKSNQKYIYLDKHSETFKFLEKIIENLKTNQDLPFYIQNFFHLYYQYIHFKLYQSILSFDDVINENYSNILQNTQINDEIKELIFDFFEMFDTKQNKQLFEIRYAYNFAFLIQDYKKVLKYMDEYQEFIYDEFFKISINIDKVEYIQKFISLKDDWINNIPKEMKKFYIKIMAKKETLPDEFLKVMEFLDDEYKVELFYKIDANLGLEIANSIKDYFWRRKSEFLVSIANKMIEYNIFDKVLEITNDMEYYDKLEILRNSIERMIEQKLFNEALETVNFIEDDLIKNQLTKKINDIKSSEISLELKMKKDYIYKYENNSINEILNMANNIKDNRDKVVFLRDVSKQMIEQELFDEALEIANFIEDDFWWGIKSKLLIDIAHKTNDKGLFEKILRITKHNLKYTNCKMITTDIIKKMIEKKLFNKVLKIINNENDYNRVTFLIDIADKTNDKELFDEALEIVSNNVKNNWEKSKFLIDIADKTNNKKLLCEIVTIVNKIEDEEDDRELKLFKKETLLEIIVKKMIKQEMFKESLEIVNNITDEWKKLEFLIDIADKMNNKKLFDEALEIVNNVEDDYNRVTFLINIADKTNNKELFNEALEIVNSIKSDWEKSELLIDIADKMNNKKLLCEILTITNNIKDYDKKSELLTIIVEKMIKQKMFKEALESMNNMGDYYKEFFSIKILETMVEAKLFDDVIKILLSMNYSKNKLKIIQNIIEISKNQNSNKYMKLLQNIITHKYLINDIDISETIDILLEIPNTEDYILQYLGIKAENKENILEGVDENTIKTIKNLLDGLDDDTLAIKFNVDVEVVKYLRN